MSGTLSPSARRRDIQGLRALAVVAVIAHHFLGRPSGGFVGVDIFFVISGFLITGILVRDFDRKLLTPTRFYRSRIRRLAPAALLTISVTVVASWLIFPLSRATSIAVDGIWAMLFVGNWRFATAGVDYFEASGPASPLQHFWTLGVEEQFYLVWPLVVVGLLLANVRFARSPGKRGFATAGLGLIVLISFAWSVYESATNPTVAYFSTLTRAWELGAGGLLALWFTALQSWRESTRLLVALAGIGSIVVALVVFDERTPFPSFWALLPVLGTVLIIAANSPRGTFVLTNRVTNYIGDISYSLYLWHLPVFVLLSAGIVAPNVVLVVAATALTLVLAIATYHLVEQPVLRSSWLLDSRGVKRARPPRGARVATWRTVALAVPAALVTSAGIVVLAASVGPAEAPRSDDGRIPVGESVSTFSSESTAALSREIQSSIGATEWPSLVPAVDDLGKGVNEEMQRDSGCLNPSDLSRTELCSYGEGSELALVVGDSFALSWMPAVRGALEGKGFTVRAIAFSTCPLNFVPMALELGASATERCNSTRQDLVDAIVAQQPDLVLIIDSEYTYTQSSVATDSDRMSEWVSGRIEAIEQLAAPDRTVVVLSPNPAGKQLEDCATRLSSPIDCESVIDGAWYDKNRADAAAAAASGAHYINTIDWFCSEGVCPSFVGGSPVRWDSGHLTAQFSERLSAPLSDVLDGLSY